MKHIFAFLALSALGFASPLAAAVDEFALSNVSAFCRPNNGGCYWSFDFVERPNEELFHCEGSVENVSRFPARMGFTACSNPAVIFQFHHYENVGVYRLSISDLRDEKSSVYAYQIWRGDEFPVLWDEVGSYQVYAGPKEFVVPATL